MIQIVTGDLLDAKQDLIVQQCNCVTVKSHGLSASIAKKYSFADVYAKRRQMSKNMAVFEDRGIPGTCVLSFPSSYIHTEKPTVPVVGALMAQIAPGKSKQWARTYKISPELDSREARLIYFKQALTNLREKCVTYGFHSVAFPFNIGCGLAGGHWPDYLAALEVFAHECSEHMITVTLYKQ
jgi:O-acetyl-ADP-ribose deacetylase (regulator of RNase III)